jgi:hypothetical protein
MVSLEKNNLPVDESTAAVLGFRAVLGLLRGHHECLLRQLDEIDRWAMALTAGGLQPSRRGRRPNDNSPLQLVRRSVESFGSYEFTLDQLCGKLAETTSGLTRMTISRRLYDLRRGPDPLVEAIRAEAGGRCRYRLRNHQAYHRNRTRLW